MVDPQFSRMTRIAVFYDGNYFSHVNNYYAYNHPRHRRLSISGLHEFIRHWVAREEGAEPKYCRVVDAHFFRGRRSPIDAANKNQLMGDRVFDHVLMHEGVVTHYLPLANNGEKGIDVWLALEALEVTLFKQFSIVVLVAGDGDYVPLVRKLNAHGVRVMILGWEFSINMPDGGIRETATSQRLLREASYPLRMHQIIDDPASENDDLINGMFVDLPQPRPAREFVPREGGTVGENPNPSGPRNPDEPLCFGTVIAVKSGYGFMRPDNGTQDVFFYWEDLVDCDFSELRDGMRLGYHLIIGDRGPVAKDIVMNFGEEENDNIGNS